ncbi:hypothetical protein [Actinacidiphila sp. bgisy145]|uniref:hypothetical protein n=1 Tax=Actinacidiphila sp. bgisy145 TaxID=3413792 RepID=UPI003EB72381
MKRKERAAETEVALKAAAKRVFADPEAVRAHIAMYAHLYREHAVTMRAAQEAALVSGDIAATLARFEASEMADILGHVTCVAEAGRPLPASPETSLRMAFDLIHAMLRTRPQRAGQVDDEAIEALTRFVYRGLNGCDY